MKGKGQETSNQTTRHRKRQSRGMCIVTDLRVTGAMNYCRSRRPTYKHQNLRTRAMHTSSSKRYMIPEEFLPPFISIVGHKSSPRGTKDKTGRILTATHPEEAHNNSIQKSKSSTHKFNGGLEWRGRPRRARRPRCLSIKKWKA